MTAAAREGAGSLDSFQLDYSNGLPVWIQIRNRITYLIGSGRYVPGDRLPTVRSLAVDLDISYNTVNRAYMDLERDGCIVTRKGRGTFVADVPSVRTAQIDGTVDLLVGELVTAASNAGMTEEDVVALVRARYSDDVGQPRS